MTLAPVNLEPWNPRTCEPVSHSCAPATRFRRAASNPNNSFTIVLAVDSLFAYVSFTAVLVLTPGSTTAVIVRNTLMGGRVAGFAAAMGAAAGNASHATAAGVGLALVFARWPTAMMALRACGATYLAWLGLRSLYRVVKQVESGHSLRKPRQPEAANEPSRRGSFRQGLTVNLLNPAIAAFYLVVVPSFLPPDASAWYFAGLAAVHVAMALVCHGLWAIALDRVRRAFASAGAGRLLEAATGVALLILAVRVWLG
jgi:threonine/homoserine/homoserine lactone efflux protein